MVKHCSKLQPQIVVDYTEDKYEDREPKVGEEVPGYVISKYMK